MSQTTHFRVRDGQTRIIEFDGEQLGEVSSRRTSSPRWTEMRLYRTDAGHYVLEKVGASTVVHAPRCPEILTSLPRFQSQHPGADPSDGSWWLCEVCMSNPQATRDITKLLVETTRRRVTISPDPAQIVDALYRRKDGARSMPKMSLDLLDEAGQSDQAILDSFRAEFVL